LRPTSRPLSLGRTHGGQPIIAALAAAFILPPLARLRFVLGREA